MALPDPNTYPRPYAPVPFKLTAYLEEDVVRLWEGVDVDGSVVWVGTTFFSCPAWVPKIRTAKYIRVVAR